MAGQGQSLGALISLTQGLDLSPLRNAQQFGLQNQQLQAQISKTLGEQELAGERIDLSRTQGVRNAALAERELTQRGELATAQRLARKDELAAQRTLDQALATMQIEGRVDLQELIGTQEIASLERKQGLDLELQESRQEFEIKQDKILSEATQANFELSFKANNDDADRRFKLLTQSGNREAAREDRGIEIDRLKEIKIKRETANLLTPEEAQARKDIDARILDLQLEQLVEETGRTDFDKREIRAFKKKLRDQQFRATEAGIAGEEARIEGQIAETAGVEATLAKLGIELERDEDGKLTGKTKKIKPPDVETGKGGLTQEEAGQLAADEELIKDETFGTSDSLDARVLAFKQIEALEASDDEDSVARKKALRRFLKATRKPGAKDLSISFGSVDEVFGTSGLTEVEIKEIDDALTELASFDIDLGEDIFG